MQLASTLDYADRHSTYSYMKGMLLVGVLLEQEVRCASTNLIENCRFAFQDGATTRMM